VTLTSVVEGKLEQPAGHPQILESKIPAALVISVESGISAAVWVSPPTFVAGPNPDPDGTLSSATIHFNGITLNNSSQAATSLPIGSTDAEVYMRVERPTQFPAGTYRYRVVLTLTAN
jgi:hypothetical protein